MNDAPENGKLTHWQGDQPLRNLRSYGLVGFGLILAFVVGLSLGSSGHDPRLSELPELPSMKQCQIDTLAVLDLKQAPTPTILRQVLDYCYSSIQGQGVLKDFAVREVNFIQQYRANAVLMWMVVAVTFSGVLLAGLQLIGSFRLATSKSSSFPNHELSLKRDQIVLKSSVTGLFILIISFAFFLVFVFYIYRFEKPDDLRGRAAQPIPTLPMGGLGPPPQSATQ